MPQSPQYPMAALKLKLSVGYCLSWSWADFLFLKPRGKWKFLLLYQKLNQKQHMKKADSFNKMVENIFLQSPDCAPRNSRVPHWTYKDATRCFQLSKNTQWYSILSDTHKLPAWKKHEVSTLHHTTYITYHTHIHYHHIFARWGKYHMKINVK